MHEGPVLSTIGVNPDILQFYVSELNGKKNILHGHFHRLFISGIFSEYSHSSSSSYLTLAVPHFHEECRYLHIEEPSAQSDSDFIHFSFTAEIDPLPSLQHRFECISCFLLLL